MVQRVTIHALQWIWLYYATQHSTENQEDVLLKQRIYKLYGSVQVGKGISRHK